MGGGISSFMIENLLCNGLPLAVNIVAIACRFPRFCIPVAGIACVSLDEVQQRVNPRTHGRVNLLRDLVRLMPVPFLRVPEGLRFRGETRGWGRLTMRRGGQFR